MTFKFNLSNDALSIVKKAAKHMGLKWETIAARPSSAARLVKYIGLLGMDVGCEKWGDYNDN